MKLTLDLFLYLMGKEYAVVRPEGVDGARPVERVRPWVSGDTPPGELPLVPGRAEGCPRDAVRIASRDCPREAPARRNMALRPGEQL